MIRAFHKNGSTLADFSKEIERYKSLSKTLTYVAGNYLYLGRPLPFNHFYVKMGATLNAIVATMSVEYWNGKEWIAVVETIDETSALSQSGYVTFVPDKNDSWTRESTSDGGEVITGLETVTIYDLYWIRISFNLTLTPAIVINWIGQLYSNDLDLYSEYPKLNNSSILACFETGKTSWEEQHVKAAEVIEQELKAQGVIIGAEQILLRQDYCLASVSKTAEIIFMAIGDDYIDDAIKAKSQFKDRLSLSIHPIDRNNDAILDIKERFERVGFLNR